MLSGTPTPARGLVLALDAAASIGTVAVLRDGRLAAERTVEMRSTLDERLLPAALDALHEVGARVTALDGIICGEGPGSFTSLRVAAAIAKGLAMGLGCPLFAVPSLALIVANSDLTVTPGSRWMATLDAMRGERYLLLVEVGTGDALTQLEPLGLLAAAGIEARAAELGARLIGPDEVLAVAPHARGAARCLALVERAGPVDLASWEPVYGRLAEAQVKRAAEEARAREAATGHGT